MTNYTINTPTISIPSDIYGLLGVGTDNTGKLITPESLVTGYVTPSSISTFTNKSGNISQWTNDVGYLTTETFTGTVTSVGATVPIGLSVSGSPITSSGTLDITFTAGYSIPTTASQANWDTAYSWGDHAVAGYLDAADIGSAVLAYDANLQAFTTAFTLPTTDGTAGQVLGTDGAGNLTFTFFAPGPVQTVTYNDGGTSTINAADGGNSIFALTANGSSTTIAMANIPSTGTRYGFELHLTWSSGAITFPASWTNGMNAPSATGNYIISGITIDGGTNYTIGVIYK